MLDYAYKYRMSSEYKYLDDDSKILIDKHIKDREELAAKQAAPAPGPGGEAGGMPDLAAMMGGGMPPVG